MSNKTYPYIGTGSQSKVIVLFYGHNQGAVIDGCGGGNSYRKGDVSHNFSESAFRSITREYLTNTYGKCESQEHADFICKIAEIHGIEFNIEDKYNDVRRFTFFNFFVDSGRLRLGFYNEIAATTLDEKLIHLPLPPKVNGMESQLPTVSSGAEMPEVKPVKPIYTKEMHELGEYPPIGSKVKLRVGYGVVELGVDSNGFFPVLTNGKYQLLDIGSVKPIPTIEDELIQFLELTSHLSQKSRVDKMLEFYNITKK